MAKFLRVAAYTFLALSGMYAWLTTQAGWRHYLGVGIFFFSSVRIMILLFPRSRTAAGADQGRLPPAGDQSPTPS